MEGNKINLQIKKIRKKKGFTQEQLADSVGVSPQAVSKWEQQGLPDTALLPQIADFLGVSIDELFGREKSDTCLEQQVLDEILSLPEDKRFERAFDFCWALCSIYNSDAIYYKASDTYSFGSQGAYSQTTTNNGFLHTRLNKNLKYFILMPEPENGYDDYLEYDEKYVQLFEFLSIKNALRVIYYLSSNPSTVFFNEKMLCDNLNLELENTQEIINGMLKLNFIWKASLDSGSSSEYIYQFISDCTFTLFMTFTKLLLNKPNWFQIQITQRNVPFFKNKINGQNGDRINEKEKR